MNNTSKHADDALAEKARLLDISTDAIIVRDASDRITFWNKGATETYGYSREEAIGRVSHDLFQTEFPEPFELLREHLVRDGQWGGELRHTCANGVRITVSTRWVAQFDESRNITSVLESNRDITDIKRAQEAQSRLAAIVESSDDAMVSKTLDGTITSWNKGAERLFAYTAEEAIGKNITLIIPFERRAEEETIIAKLRRGERVEHFDTVRQRKDGGLVDVSLTISPVKDASGHVIGASKVARDITERRAAEKALQKAHDRLESMVEERTAAVRQLSLRLLTVQDQEHRTIARELHDSLGQDLAAMKMDLQRMRKATSEGQAAELVSRLSEALEKCLSETRTISYLLHPPLIDELGFVPATKWYLEGFSERSGIKLNLQLSDNSARMPPAVELPLFRVLQAALSNVHRHAESALVDIRFEVAERRAKLEVRDYGKGIDPGLLKRFESGGAGVGIGLAGMRERLRELGGRLEVQSDATGTLIRAVVPI